MNPTTFSELYTIFNSKRWHDKDGHDIVFRNFCYLLSNLTEHQQRLLLELAERYTWLTFSEYQSKLVSILNRIPDSEINSISKIILFPIMKPKDEEKTKSGHGILLILRGVKPLLSRFEHIDLKEVERFEYFDHPKFSLGQNERIFLLDDFLGTGDTVRSTVEMILSKPTITNNKIKVVSIAAHIQSANYLKDVGIELYTDLITPKGISDHYTSPILEEKIELMKQIEKLIPNNKYSFGYGQSEALITLYRTPNNTFPIFWNEHEKNNEKFKAPFPRF